MENTHEQTDRTSLRGGSKPSAHPDLLTAAEGAALLGVLPITLRRYRHQGKLAAYRLPGGRIRYQRADLLALLASVVA